MGNTEKKIFAVKAVLLMTFILLFTASSSICPAETVEELPAWTAESWEMFSDTMMVNASPVLLELLQEYEQEKPIFVETLEESEETAKVCILPNGTIYRHYTRLGHETIRNELLYASDLDGRVYNTYGYADNRRYSASTQSDQELSGWDITGYIPVKINKTVQMKNIEFFSSAQTSRSVFVFFDAEKKYLSSSATFTSIGDMGEAWSAVADDNGQLIEFTIPGNYSQEIAYFRIVAKDITPLSAVTVNKPIEELQEISKWYRVASFYPMKMATPTPEPTEVPATPAPSPVPTEVPRLAAEENVQLPDYWQQHADEKIALIRGHMAAAGRRKSAFLWYTDTHGVPKNSYSPALLRYLYENTAINKVNFGGGIGDSAIESGSENGEKYLWDWRQAVRGLPHHHSVVGNHDDGNATDNILRANYVYSYLMAPEECNDIVRGGDFYYYIDDVNERTRYIYLDTAFENILYDLAQQEWLMEVLISTPAGWHIIPIAHIWTTVDYDQVPPVATGFSYGGETAIYMFDAYNAREAEFADCLGRVEFCIGGHAHTDAVFRSSTGIPVIITEPDCIDSRSGITVKSGTIDENAVSAVIADYDAGVVHVVRVGRGADMDVTLH